MKKILALTCVLTVLLLTCSKKSTDQSDNDGNPIDTPLAVSYTGDPQRAVEQSVAAAAGGSITATDQSGVEFTLAIPPSALSSDATIKVTPLASLRLEGISGAVCTGCTGSDSLCCLHGILLEPTGLALDSPATLTITFPPSQFPFEQGGWIAYIDSSGSKYQVCHTDIDTVNHTLIAGIMHFSGYGSDDPRYEELEREIYRLAALLESAIGTSSFQIYSNMLLALYPAFECQGEGCPDFSDLYRIIETTLLDCWTSHVYGIRHAVTGTSCDALQSLYGCCYELSHSGLHVLSNWQSFSPLEVELMSDARAMAHFLADLGKQQCGRDSCASGQHSLSCVIDFIRDADLAEQEGELLDSATAWFTSCCKNKLALTVDKSKIYDCALAEGDMSQVAFFTATLTDEVGPVPDHTVDVSGWDDKGHNIVSSGTTNDDGVATIRVCLAPEGTFAAVSGDYKWVASTTVGEDLVKSDTVMLALVNRMLVMSYVYQYSYGGGTQYCSWSGSNNFRGTGKKSARGGASCVSERRWLMTRTIDHTEVCNVPPPGTSYAVFRRSLPENDSMACCFFNAIYDARWIDDPAPGYPQYLVTAAAVNNAAPLYRSCWVEVTQTWSGFPSEVDTVNDCYCYLPPRSSDTAVCAAGGFSPITWDTSFVGQQTPITYTVSLSVAFSFEEEGAAENVAAKQPPYNDDH